MQIINLLFGKKGKTFVSVGMVVNLLKGNNNYVSLDKMFATNMNTRISKNILCHIT